MIKCVKERQRGKAREKEKQRKIKRGTPRGKARQQEKQRAQEIQREREMERKERATHNTIRSVSNVVAATPTSPRQLWLSITRRGIRMPGASEVDEYLNLKQHYTAGHCLGTTEDAGYVNAQCGLTQRTLIHAL